jgi:hypothetical protein
MHATIHVMPAHAYELMIDTTSQQKGLEMRQFKWLPWSTNAFQGIMKGYAPFSKSQVESNLSPSPLHPFHFMGLVVFRVGSVGLCMCVLAGHGMVSQPSLEGGAMYLFRYLFRDLVWNCLL